MATPCHTTPLSAPLEDGEDLPRARFLNELAARELVHLGHDRFAGEVDAAAAAALGEAVLVRAKADGSTLEAFVRLEDGPLLLLDFGYGSVSVEVAAGEREPVDAALERLRGALAKPEPEEDDVPFAFWALGARGRGKVRRRDLEAGAWSELRGHYAASTAARLDGGRGSGTAQLLNLTDGLMGQGARALVLITTNEPAAVIKPALRRPGRCLAEVEFAPLSAAEASRWLDAEVTRAHTLSELFALRDGHDAAAPEGPASRHAFGFARAILFEALKPDLERVISQ